MPRSDTSPPAPVEWDLDVTDSAVLATLAYVFPSVLGGVVVLAVGLLAWLVVAAVQAGDLARAVVLLVVALVGLLVRRSLPALLATDVAAPLRERYSRRGLLLGSLLGAAVLLGSARLHPAAPFAVFVASWVPLVLTAGFPTAGHADPETGTLDVDGRTVPLAAVRGVQALPVGAFAVCWLSYARGVPSAPRVVVLPSDALGPVRRLVERASDTNDGTDSTIGRPVRVVAGLFGLGMVALGPALWLVLPPGDGRLVAVYAGALTGSLGLVFLWYAYSG